jgi:hypothetical protein
MKEHVNKEPTIESIIIALKEQNQRLSAIEEKLGQLERQSMENKEAIEEICMSNGELKKLQATVEELLLIIHGDDDLGIPNMVREFRAMNEAFHHIEWLTSRQTLALFFFGLIALIGWITTIITH